jgi:hypothetical protein
MEQLREARLKPTCPIELLYLVLHVLRRTVIAPHERLGIETKVLNCRYKQILIRYGKLHGRDSSCRGFA